MSRLDDIKELIKKHNRRLQNLKEKQASFGLETPVSVLTEIEDIESEIVVLQDELERLDIGKKNRGQKFDATAETGKRVFSWWTMPIGLLIGVILVVILMKSFSNNFGEPIQIDKTDTSIFDDFSVRSPRWPIGEDSSGELKSRKYITNGVYIWETTPFTTTASTIEPAVPLFTDFDFKVDMKQTKGPDDIAYGVLFRSNSQDGWYRFSIRNKGDFDLIFISPKGYKWLIPWSSAPAIGVDRNTLRVVAIGDKLKLSVNGVLIAEIIDDSSKFGKVGLYASLWKGVDVTFEVDNFQISSLDK